MLLPAASASASCVPPTVEVAPTSAAVGATIHVTGNYWASDCSDTGGPPAPPDSVRIYFVQDGVRTLLGTVTASTSYAIALTSTVPATARPGQARVRAEGKRAGTQETGFTVAASSPTTGSLPFTGASRLALLAMVGTGVLVAGITLTCLARVRRRSVST